jgi:hypothetical protein
MNSLGSPPLAENLGKRNSRLPPPQHAHRKAERQPVALNGSAPPVLISIEK